MRLIFDFGNALGKWFNPNPKAPSHDNFIHAVYPLSSREWSSVVRSNSIPSGFVKIDGQGYAIGNAARRYVLKEKPKGASRYTAEYYGPAACFAMAEAFRRSGNVNLYASHAPRDQRYSDRIVSAMKRDWVVESEYGTLEFSVAKVITFDEPLGGYTHFALNDDGTERKKNPVAKKTTLVIDVGGYTIDSAAIDPGGIIDPLSLKSSVAGTMKAVEQFEDQLKDRYADEFQRTQGELDIRRVESAIVSGSYQFGRKALECQSEAAAAINVIVNDAIAAIDAAGGAANYDIILLTGGGSALIYDVLCAAFPDIEFIMVEPNRSEMKYANVFGGAKIANLLAKVSA